MIPDFEWERTQIIKRKLSIRLCWRRYCKRAYKQDLMPYSWSRYLILYKKYLSPSDTNDMNGIVHKLRKYNILLSIMKNKNKSLYESIKQEKEEWLKSIHLKENKIIKNSEL